MDETGGGLTTVYTDSASLPHFGAIDGIRLIHHRRPTCEISITPAVRSDSQANRIVPGQEACCWGTVSEGSVTVQKYEDLLWRFLLSYYSIVSARCQSPLNPLDSALFDPIWRFLHPAMPPLSRTGYYDTGAHPPPAPPTIE